MRVASKSLYDTSRFRLGGLTSDLQKSNTVVTTGKQINTISDDPIGLSQVMNLKSSVSSIEQIGKNIDTGKVWLKAEETALSSIKDLMMEVKKQTSQLISASANADQREEAIDRIGGILEEIVELGNTQVNGSYIFGGSKNDTPPFVYHKDTNPPHVTYEGDHQAFSIRTGEEKSIQVGEDGSSVFWQNRLTVDDSNGTLTFREDNGHGEAFRKTMTVQIPKGSYSTEELRIMVGNLMTEASQEDGYGLHYEVSYDENEQHFNIADDGTKPGFVRTEVMWDTGGDPRVENASVTGSIKAESLEIRLLEPDALTISTPDPKKSEPLRLVWNGEGSWLVKDNPGYVLPNKIADDDGIISLDLNENGVNDLEIRVNLDGIREGDTISFDMVAATGDVSIGQDLGFYDTNTALAPPTGESPVSFITSITIGASNQNIDFSETDSLGVATTATATIPPGTYSDMGALTAAIEAQLEASSPNGVDYAVTYDAENSKFFIREDGGTLNRLDLLWESGPSAGISSAGETLGFAVENDVVTYPVSDKQPVLFSVTGENNRLDFEEIDGAGTSGIRTAVIPAGEYRSVADLETAIETAMNAASAKGTTYDVTYDAATRKFSIADAGPTLTELRLPWVSGPSNDDSIGDLLGFETSTDDVGATSHVADDAANMITINNTNNKIDFVELDEQGNLGTETSITLPNANYSDPALLAAEIQTRLREASPNGVQYSVGYDSTNNRFTIKGGGEGVGETRFLWHSGKNKAESAATTLGFDTDTDDSIGFPKSDETVVRVVVGSGNNKIDFKEVMGTGDSSEFCELTAEIPPGTYTSFDDLAAAVESAMETESRNKGFTVDYSVSFDSITRKFTIKDVGNRLSESHLLWGSGQNRPAEGGSGESMGALLGFSATDDTRKSMESNRDKEWGIFRTLNDLMADLSQNDVEGLEKGISRIEADYQHVNSVHANAGIRYNRLEIQEAINMDMKLSFTERRSNLEDADMIEAIMNLQSRELAYNAALNSTSKIMKLSLVDFV